MGVGDGGLLPRETRSGGMSLLIRHALAPVPIQLVVSESDLIRLCPLQMFERQKAEDAIISFAPDRTEFDITDPEGHNCTPVEDVDPEAAARSGKTPPSNPIRDWTDDDEDECVFLEVFDFCPLLFFLLLFAHQLIQPLRLQRRFRSGLFRVNLR